MINRQKPNIKQLQIREVFFVKNKGKTVNWTSRFQWLSCQKQHGRCPWLDIDRYCHLPSEACRLNQISLQMHCCSGKWLQLASVSQLVPVWEVIQWKGTMHSFVFREVATTGIYFPIGPCMWGYPMKRHNAFFHWHGHKRAWNGQVHLFDQVTITHMGFCFVFMSQFLLLWQSSRQPLIFLSCVLLGNFSVLDKQSKHLSCLICELTCPGQSDTH